MTACMHTVPHNLITEAGPFTSMAELYNYALVRSALELSDCVPRQWMTSLRPQLSFRPLPECRICHWARRLREIRLKASRASRDGRRGGGGGRREIVCPCVCVCVCVRARARGRSLMCVTASQNEDMLTVGRGVSALSVVTAVPSRQTSSGPAQNSHRDWISAAESLWPVCALSRRPSPGSPSAAHRHTAIAIHWLWHSRRQYFLEFIFGLISVTWLTATNTVRCSFLLYWNATASLLTNSS